MAESLPLGGDAVETQVPIPPEHLENSDPMRKQLEWIETIEKRLAAEKARSISIYKYQVLSVFWNSPSLTCQPPHINFRFPDACSKMVSPLRS